MARILDQIRTGFWFTPIVMLLLASVLALLMLYLDERLDPGIKASLAWAYSGGPEGARSLLSTIAGSMITAASVTFSLAAVALSISSQQYGSRVLRNFMRDRITQVLLGTFTSTFIYSVLVVRSIRGSGYGGGFVPAISVTIAIALSLASLVLLIFFVHHISTSIQASRIIRVIAEEIRSAVPRLYPSETAQPLEDHGALDRLRQRDNMAVSIAKDGYLQTIDLDRLLEIAKRQNVVIEVLIKPGDHLIPGKKVAQIWGSTTLAREDLQKIIGTFLLGGERTPSQDIRFQFQQLTDVVVRSLSPGINDPFTAINGIDELASGISLLARRAPVSDERQDGEGALRLIVPTPTVGEILDETVGHIAIYAAGDRFVMTALCRVLDAVEHDLYGHPDLFALRDLREDMDRRKRTKTSS